MVNPYVEWFEGLRAEYGEQLKQMPLPDGLPEHLRDLMAKGDEEAILFMLKLAWQLGAQVGYSAGQQQSGAGQPSRKVSSVQA
ncbi:DdrH [Deinococcus irradiatisoli]|uniref:DdrH n=1 Tax=Deinococcus irradiatisoli TaxID=2202254 RepID=A0A2Z3JTF6_9DEIO|nr:DdrH [Deinococcus irradiatisoli]AWN23934.1 DdrH [Deinococcus irradiatisoli]